MSHGQRHDRSGQGVVEYAILVATVSLGLILLLGTFRNTVGNVLRDSKNLLGSTGVTQVGPLPGGGGGTGGGGGGQGGGVVPGGGGGTGGQGGGGSPGGGAGGGGDPGGGGVQPQDPNADDDGDGIPNGEDDDDNQNGIPDDEEPVVQNISGLGEQGVGQGQLQN